MSIVDPTLNDVLSELHDIRKQLAITVDFINTLQTVLADMSSNPMLKAFGIGSLDGLQIPVADLPMLPGMPDK